MFVAPAFADRLPWPAVDGEATVAELLGMPAAVFLPSGTMAQAATLRVHADQRGRRTVLWTWSQATTTEDPGVVRCVLGVGRGTCVLSAAEVAAAISERCR